MPRLGLPAASPARARLLGGFFAILSVSFLFSLAPVRRLVFPAIVRLEEAAAGLGLGLRLALSPKALYEAPLLSCTNDTSALVAMRERVTELESIIENLEGAQGYAASPAIPSVSARVLLWSGAGEEPTITLDKGQNDVALGDVVLTPSGALLGVVHEVKEETASVALLTHESLRISVSVAASDRAIGLTEGEGGASGRVRYIPKDAALTVGDTLVTSGLSTTIPPGIPLGRITAVNETPSAPLKEADYVPLHDPRTITRVTILRTTSL